MSGIKLNPCDKHGGIEQAENCENYRHFLMLFYKKYNMPP